MSPALTEIFRKRMRPTVLHALIAVEWFAIEDAVEACLHELEAGDIDQDGVRDFMASRFGHLTGVQKSMVIGCATIRARSCFLDLQLSGAAA